MGSGEKKNGRKIVYSILFFLLMIVLQCCLPVQKYSSCKEKKVHARLTWTVTSTPTLPPMLPRAVGCLPTSTTSTGLARQVRCFYQALLLGIDKRKVLIFRSHSKILCLFI